MTTLKYEGKAKRIFQSEQENRLIAEYMDQITAGNGEKKDHFVGKGELINQITAAIFELLNDYQIEHHYIEQLSDMSQLIQALDMIPLEVVVRNYAAGSFVKRLGWQEKAPLPFPIVEFYYKNDDLGDPFINDEQACLLANVTMEEIEMMKQSVLQLNQALVTIFDQCQLTLADFKVEYGKNIAGEIVLGDEISPDTCRLWDKETGYSFDKDGYRKSSINIVPIYTEVLDRIQHLKGEKSC